ncbi:MAG: ATP-binding protein, partial [bacterium]
TGEQTLYIATLVKSRSKPVKTLAILVLAKPLTDIQNAIEQIRITIAMAFFAVLIVLFIVFIGVSNFITQPLARLSVTTERYAAGMLNERVKPRGASEIYSIGVSFNRMADQLRQTITRLAAERAQAEAMLTSMTDGVIVTDIPGKIRMVNHSTELMCDISERDVRGKTLAEAGFPEMLDEQRMKSQTTRLPLQFEFTLDHTPMRIIEVHMAPIEVDGEMLGVVVVFYDVTQQRKLEQVHRDFVANVSHELRTPVTSIRAMAETMITIGNEDEELRNDFLQTTISESERLSGLLDDLLNLSRIESGSMHLSPEELDISDIVQHVAQRLIAPIAQKGQQLQMDLPPSFPAYIDHDALVQITLNLIDNARKYSPEGAKISISLRQVGDACHLQVTDTGVGISDEGRERIFERFYRVDKARSRGLGGTGLGLAIVKQLVELLHGQISVTSKPGKGSTFSVVIPDVVRTDMSSDDP